MLLIEITFLQNHGSTSNCKTVKLFFGRKLILMSKHTQNSNENNKKMYIKCRILKYSINQKECFSRCFTGIRNSIIQKKPPKCKPQTQNHVSSYLINLNHTASHVKWNPISLSNCYDNYSQILEEQEQSICEGIQYCVR